MLGDFLICLVTKKKHIFYFCVTVLIYFCPAMKHETFAACMCVYDGTQIIAQLTSVLMWPNKRLMYAEFQIETIIEKLNVKSTQLNGVYLMNRTTFT